MLLAASDFVGWVAPSACCGVVENHLKYIERKMAMTVVFDTLRISDVASELSDEDIRNIAGLFDIHEYPAGEVIVRPGQERAESLLILAEGEIGVEANGTDGTTVLETLRCGDLAGMITFVGGAASQVSATLYAKCDIKVLSLDQCKAENMVKSHPMIAYRLVRGVARGMQGIVRVSNIQNALLSSYINQAGRY
jgi:CRP-like cAMP-binding protein